MSYYKAAFEKLIEAGVPRWYIRLYLLTDIIYCSRVYVYRNVYDIETQDGWYATTGISINSTPADRNRKCYGELTVQYQPYLTVPYIQNQTQHHLMMSHSLPLHPFPMKRYASCSMLHMVLL